jgi:hypothetical protein
MDALDAFGDGIRFSGIDAEAARTGERLAAQLKQYTFEFEFCHRVSF